MNFPKQGMTKTMLLRQMQERKQADAKWQEGRTFSLVYHPANDEIMQMVKDAYLLFFNENGLNPNAFPSLKKMENEVIAMCADLFRGNENTCGSMTSCGTESIFLALKTARAWANKHKSYIKEPEIILATSAHPAFQKACHYLGIKAVVVPMDAKYRADMTSIWQAINRNTIMIIGSAPAYPHGVIDPIEKMAKLALENNLLLHVDACVGGFMLPFMEKLGYEVPAFDFSLDGVTSISADLHKYGYAAKGASVILYNDKELRKQQFFVYSNWVGGIYASATASGTRPGGAIAAAWAALNGIGLDGYLKLAKTTMNTTTKLKRSIESIDGLKILGQPDMSILAIASDKINVYAVADELSTKGWYLDRQQDPPSIHLTISPIHAQYMDEFLIDLRESYANVSKISLNKISTKIQVAAVKGLKRFLPDKAFNKIQSTVTKRGNVSSKNQTAAMYGMMNVLADSENLDEMIIDLLDKTYSLEEGKM